MTLREIKAESLRLMALGDGSNLETTDLDILTRDVRYRSYFDAMPGAINRALGRLEQRRAIPPKRYTLSPLDGVVAGNVVRFDLATLISGFFAVERVDSDSKYGYDFLKFFMEGDTLVLSYSDVQNASELTLLYYELLPRITHSTSENFVLPVPDRAACLIPYYVKSDLFNEEEPSEAAAARNLFEAGLDELSFQSFGASRAVTDIYSFSEV